VNNSDFGTVDSDRESAMQGDVVVIFATANAGHEFERWEILAGGITIGNLTLPTVSFTMLDRDVSVRAHFRPISYTVTVSVNNSAFGSAASNLASAPQGTVVNLTATPESGYEFYRWEVLSGGVTVSDVNSQTTAMTMRDANVIIMAHFRAPTPETYEITVSASSGGTARSEPVRAPVGANISIFAEAQPGFAFSHWNIQFATLINPNSANTSFTMPSNDVIIHAVFVEIQLPPDPGDE